ncbi:upstream activation factor subunit spp27 isoform X1 [Cryptomeria japonica]|uniref:upstream activation factor subunit spp27 isoform X1 n=1 Tax=Cryptomeria japonica TaxID=3369 RepID=UPI0025ABBD4F|nr:upstream activation factor subunit spp27 isoform X1 [Cryptomeria japonica]XP_057863341.1 upstream activation factor subunit spp27 isoform X1 [Cryptomeria japonica]XP_057863342.1 upstream activation factor subunit spp27 isoform X1 [Cryptomeria japonica]XP_057863343.1 upstream activation factor subunit spp27 isoform X1 [Cryptomeria japonica]
MVSDSEIAERLKEILRTADLTTTTTASIRRKLQDELQLDLSDKKAFIREQVDLYLLYQQQQQQQHNNNEVKEEEEAEPSSEQEEDEQGEDEDEEEEEEEDEGNDKIRKKKGSIKEKKKRGTGGGFTKLCGLSPELQALLGVSELPRTQVVKQLWVYIKEHNLQDPQNKRKIICDDKLRTVFKKSSIDMFEMSKVLSDHIFRLEKENEGSEDPEPKAKRQKPEKTEGGKGKGGGGKGKTSGLCSPLPLSDALVAFLGTGESELSRAEVVKRIWGYIKDNNLQDPSDKRRILCDEKLHELFGCDTFIGFGVAKLLSTHFLKS